MSNSGVLSAVLAVIVYVGVLIPISAYVWITGFMALTGTGWLLGLAVWAVVFVYGLALTAVIDRIKT